MTGFFGHNFRWKLVWHKRLDRRIGGLVVFKGEASKYLSYEYKSASLIGKVNEPIRLIFDTEVVEGVSFHFEGAYLKRRGDSAAGDKVYLEGVITKLMNGQKVAEDKLRFSPSMIQE